MQWQAAPCTGPAAPAHTQTRSNLLDRNCSVFEKLEIIENNVDKAANLNLTSESIKRGGEVLGQLIHFTIFGFEKIVKEVIENNLDKAGTL